MSRLFPVEHDANTDDWYTPPWVFAGMAVRFDLDVCAPPGGVPWVPADRHFTIADDGLSEPWAGIVWCNPPYSSPTLWCRRWAHHSDGALLIRADLSTAGPHLAFSAAHAIYFAPKRIQFVNGRGGPTGAVTFTTVLLARGAACVDGLHRLALNAGGTTRVLVAPAT